MFSIAFVDRVRLNYSSCTIASIVLYTFFVSFLTEYSSKLWPHVIYFVIVEVLKLFIIQKFYSLDLSNNFEGSRRRRTHKVNDSFKFAALMLLTVCIFAFICIVLGGEYSTRVLDSLINFLIIPHFILILQRLYSIITRRLSHCQHSWRVSPSFPCLSSSAFLARFVCWQPTHTSCRTSWVSHIWSFWNETRFWSHVELMLLRLYFRSTGIVHGRSIRCRMLSVP